MPVRLALVLVLALGLALRCSPHADAAPGLTLTGRVLDGAGQPLAGATVHVLRDDITVTTDAQGAYVVPGQSLGWVFLYATTTTLGSAMETLELQRGGSTVVPDLVMQPSMIAGTVRDPRGAPLSHRRVQVRFATQHHGWFFPEQVVTDAAGAFQTGGIPVATYDVLVVRDPRPRGGSEGPFIEPGVTVPTGTSNVALVVRDPGRVIGRVMLDGKPVPDFGVALYRNRNVLPYPKPQRVSDPDGRFEVGNVEAGTWSVAIVGGGFIAHITDDVVIDGATTDLGTLRLVRGNTLQGRVVDRNGAPVEGAIVAAFDPCCGHGNDALYEVLRGNSLATTDAHGRYKIESLPGDISKLQVEVRHPIHGITPRQEVRTGTADFTLTPAGRIVGTIANFNPSHKFVMLRSATDPSLQRPEYADANGSFKFDDVPAGTYTVSLSRATPASIQVSVPAGGTGTVRFAMHENPPQVELRGTCSSVRLGDPGPYDFGGYYEWMPCHDHGATFGAVVPGRYEVCSDQVSQCTTIDVLARPAVQRFTLP